MNEILNGYEDFYGLQRVDMDEMMTINGGGSNYIGTTEEYGHISPKYIYTTSNGTTTAKKI